MDLDDFSDSPTPHQDNVSDLVVDLFKHDTALLEQLDPVDLVRQLRARRALLNYANALWDAAKETVEAEGRQSQPDAMYVYNSVGALADLSSDLYGNAYRVFERAGHPPYDEGGDVTMWAERPNSAPPDYRL